MLEFTLLIVGIVGFFLAVFAVVICLNNAKSKKYEYRLRKMEYAKKYGRKPSPEWLGED